MEMFFLVFSMKVIILLHHSRLSLEVERPGREANY